MSRHSKLWVALFTLLLCAMPGASRAISISAGFLQPNPQIFPVGELVSIEDIEQGNDIDMGSLPVMFYISISPTVEPPEQQIIMDVELRAGAMRLVKFVSTPFLLADWVSSPIGNNGRYNNVQLSDLQDDGTVLGENSNESEYIGTSDFLNLLDGSNMSAGLYMLTVMVYNANEDGSRGVLLGSYVQNTQVYNPVPPTLQSPEDGDEISGYPIFFSWNWNAGFVSTQDIKLIIVEGLPGEDGESVIASRNPSNTRYNGPPQLMESHTYTGFAGGERGLTPGATFYWMITMDVNTIVPGSRRAFESNVYSFTFAPSEPGAGGGAPAGGQTQGGVDPFLDQLSSILPSDVMQSLYSELNGFFYHSVRIDGVGGYSQQDLLTFLNSPDITIVVVGLED